MQTGACPKYGCTSIVAVQIPWDMPGGTSYNSSRLQQVGAAKCAGLAPWMPLIHHRQAYHDGKVTGGASVRAVRAVFDVQQLPPHA
jgi:hypothetical protein